MKLSEEWCAAPETRETRDEERERMDTKDLKVLLLPAVLVTFMNFSSRTGVLVGHTNLECASLLVAPPKQILTL